MTSDLVKGRTTSRQPRKRIRIPKKLRRLTRDEASRLGVSYKAKHRVNANIKKVTSTTRTYTDREVAQSKLHTTKEKYTARRVQEVKSKKTGLLVSKVYEDLTKSAFMKLLRKYKDHIVMAMYQLAPDGSSRRGARYKDEDGIVWITTDRIYAYDLIEHYEHQLELAHITKPPVRFGLRIYPLPQSS